MSTSFGDALKVLKDGGRVARSGWNGAGMYLWLQKSTGTANSDWYFPWQKCIVLKTADGFNVPWTASQTDLLFEDWVRVYPDRKSDTL